MSSPQDRNESSESPAAATAIVGGGISGLATAYELGRRGAAFALFEASGRFGGIVETIRSQKFVIECGPDSWITEKPWAGELAAELGLKDEILPSNDRWRRTFLVKEGKLAALPDGMRMMVPVKWAPLLESPLFSWEAKLAYLREPRRAAELKASAQLHQDEHQDESVAEFVRRHFGKEVTDTIAGPLLAGVFGGDVEALSARAVMPAFVKMEAEHGSLITALRQSAQESKAPIFSTLASGLGTLVDRLVASLPPQSLHLEQPVASVSPDGDGWRVITPGGEYRFDSLVLATPPHVTRQLLAPLGDNGDGQRMADLLPRQATSAIIVALAFDPPQATRMRIPRGFGFLVMPPTPLAACSKATAGSLLACTFVDQKFSHRAPAGATLLRAYFGGHSAEALLHETDETLVQRAREQLGRILGPLPEPQETLVRRWPLSLPQYTVGHNERMSRLEALAQAWPGLHLVGNAYHGVGVSDLIREGRATARKILDQNA